MNDETDGEIQAAIRLRLAQIRQEHGDLGASIEALLALPQPDQLRVARLKKRKLILRDLIVKLENELTPDLIA
jgi:hypothetical protein